MNTLHTICVLAGFIGGMATYAVMDWLTSLRQPRAEPTHIGDSTSGLGL